MVTQYLDTRLQTQQKPNYHTKNTYVIQNTSSTLITLKYLKNDMNYNKLPKFENLYIK